MPMPFSPCDVESTGQCNDQSVDILRQIFGPVIDKLVTGADASTIDSTTNILSTVLSVFNQGAFIVLSLIISYTLLMGVANTANDGEALGKNWSTVWTPVRLVSFSGMLLPTTSGYSFIQFLVLMIALWGAGFANWAYRGGVSIGLIAPNAVVGGIYKSGEFYGIRDFASNYLSVAYCKRVANSVYSSTDAQPSVTAVPFKDDISGISYAIKDVNQSTALAGGSPFCGTVTINKYKAGTSDDKATQILENLHAAMQKTKYDVAQQLTKDIDTWVNSWPDSLSSASWSTVDSQHFNDLVTNAENKIIDSATNSAQGQSNELSTEMQKYITALTDKGWINASGWFQKVGKVREMLSQVIGSPVGTVQLPTYTGLPNDQRTSQLVGVVTTITDKIRTASDKKLTPGESSTGIQSMGALVPTNPENIDITSLQSAIDSATSRTVAGVMNTVVNTLVESDDNHQGSTLLCGAAGQMGGSLNRMKCVGDYLTLVYDSIYVSDKSIKLQAAAVRMVASLASSGKVLGTGLDADKPTNALWDFIMEVVSPILAGIMAQIFPLAVMLSVILPAAPNMIFIVVVVGWFLAVLQSIIAVTLWALIHATPERSFIGGQTQGYLLLLSLFVRPILAIIGLFASFLLADPIIGFITNSFFSVYNAVSASTSVGFITQFTQFIWWMYAYAGLLVPVLYMIFGLPQILPDHVLKWINIGISDLGETHAANKQQYVNSRIMSEQRLFQASIEDGRSKGQGANGPGAIANKTSNAQQQGGRDSALTSSPPVSRGYDSEL
ncbi:DotA/TraY family protein [Citrobacter freundii]|uniref:DotA/TraY family protein n=1 Tax=Citrobacter freundii TaxID=546 RepID=UPI0019067BE2|nr:DotA/TraY family protein [Citrobacter freundii]MBJ8931580.1 DotA/TraY family protein [Citrobacter freundii]